MLAWMSAFPSPFPSPWGPKAAAQQFPMKTDDTPTTLQLTPQEERGGVLGFALICLLALVTVAALRAPAASRDVAVGVFLMVWGCMFLAAYFFSHKTFFLRGLIWFCTRMSCPSTPKMAFFYAFMTFGMGVVAVMSGLGWV